jgi:hypothetical protein
MATAAAAADWPSAFAAHIGAAGLAAAWQFEERPGSWASMGDDLIVVLEQAWRQPAEGGLVVCTASRRTVFLVNHLLGDASYRYDLSPEGTGVQRNLTTRTELAVLRVRIVGNREYVPNKTLVRLEERVRVRKPHPRRNDQPNRN